MTAIDPRWQLRDNPDRYKGMSSVQALNKIYAAELARARKEWARTHAEAEPGRGLDGRPLQKGARTND